MKKSKNNSSKFKFKKYESVGSADAENDSHLDEVFIDKGEYDALVDVSNPRSIIIGRTGSGKSALIKKILSEQSHVVRIEPDVLSLKYLSNSTILEYLRSLDVNLHFFYKILWKHVFVVEIIKLYLGEEGNKKQKLFQKLGFKSRENSKADKARADALSYFDKWSEEFWKYSEHRVTNITNKLEDDLKQELGAKYKDIGASLSKGNKKSKEESLEIKNKAETVISKLQADDLIKIIDILGGDVFNNIQRKYFIVIDDLDKEWVTQQIVYDLIGSMIEVIKEFQIKFSGVKIIIALRENLYKIIFSGKKHRGGQREKIASLYLQLSWNKDELTQLMNRRLQILTNNQLDIKSSFAKSGSRKNSFDYIIERTFMRPRDIISYFNKIIENANNKSQFTDNMVKIAEEEYSHERLQALEDEWYDNFGEIKYIYNFLIGINDGFNFVNIKADAFAELFIEDSALIALKGDLYEAASNWKSGKDTVPNFRVFFAKILFILYRIGILGVKVDAQSKTKFFYSQGPSITEKEITKGCKFYIHKSLYSSLKINTKEQEIGFLD
jgi:hypothetical protein